ncbi:MAG: hypothetical protein RLZZ156_1310 [Deinococcota bacterium]|jgi:hypothetical protein
MRILRELKQSRECSGQTLKEFYVEVSQQTPHLTDIANEMIALLDHLESLSDPRTLYALTSHTDLWFVSNTIYGNDVLWLVKIGTNGMGWYNILCWMPDHLAPWKNAFIQGNAFSKVEVVKMILSALDFVKEHMIN